MYVHASSFRSPLPVGLFTGMRTKRPPVTGHMPVPFVFSDQQKMNELYCANCLPVGGICLNLSPSLFHCLLQPGTLHYGLAYGLAFVRQAPFTSCQTLAKSTSERALHLDRAGLLCAALLASFAVQLALPRARPPADGTASRNLARKKVNSGTRDTG
jgi:hypothetical protein